MNRRDFIKNMAVGGVLLHLPTRLFPQTKAYPDLALIQGDSPSQITKEAVATLGGIKRFISKGDVVIIKPNIGWDRTPEQAACTNPEVVKALVELCKDADAKEVIVLDNTINPARRTYARSGIAKAAKEAGAKVPYPNPHHVKKMAISGEWLKEWDVYTDFVEADKIINVPIAKTHSLSRLTMGLKNWLGAIDGPRNQLHQALDFAMIDLANFFKPTLTILDAYRILVRNGPQGGRLSDAELHKTVVAGVDYVAVDAIGATFFGIKPEELRYLDLASQKGFGRIDLEKLNIEKRTV
ncbi:MAG: DUF362 domain-containing protein [Candidatus Aminicenantes bacterium]|nr:DUF362 domain-containing protein [Candidatus Aminicenantes bacterium]MDH5384883.1 DUF362 domain-containing protein [Candidatus Aminicenantes bacterium]MDH5742960.1 DUF362 domain-containing protein [Candidatus Aminicenantes bacterium]